MSNRENMHFKQYWPVGIFLLFLGLILGATLYYAPSWGLMDDWQWHDNVERILGGDSFSKDLWSVIKTDLTHCGPFIPAAYIWSVFTYHIFREAPLTIYILKIIFNFGSLALWGLVLHKLFSPEKERGNMFLTIFIFPLAFFVFTPLWNIFMYISIVHGFVLFFSALSLYFLKKGYDSGRITFIVLSLICVLSSILFHPLGIYLVAAYIVFSLLDIIFIHHKKSISFLSLAMNTFLFIAYYTFTVRIQLLANYTLRYKTHLSLGGIMDNILGASVVIKLIIVLAICMCVYMFIAVLLKKNKFSPLALLMPLGALSYILVLSPWAFINYQLSALTPHALGLFFPFYAWGNRKGTAIKILNNILIISLVMATFLFIIVPRISKMGDIKKIEDFMRELPDNTYFFPPPFPESAAAMGHFSNSKIIYLGDAILSKEMLKLDRANLLIFGDECSEISLENVRVGGQVYESDTWIISYIIIDNGYNAKFKIDFPQNSFQKIKTYLRDL